MNKTIIYHVYLLFLILLTIQAPLKAMEKNIPVAPPTDKSTPETRGRSSSSFGTLRDGVKKLVRELSPQHLPKLVEEIIPQKSKKEISTPLPTVPSKEKKYPTFIQANPATLYPLDRSPKYMSEQGQLVNKSAIVTAAKRPSEGSVPSVPLLPQESQDLPHENLRQDSPRINKKPEDEPYTPRTLEELQLMSQPARIGLFRLAQRLYYNADRSPDLFIPKERYIKAHTIFTDLEKLKSHYMRYKVDVYLGEMTFHGLANIPKDINASVRYFKSAEEQRDMYALGKDLDVEAQAKARMWLAYIFFIGCDVYKKDDHTAKELFEQAHKMLHLFNECDQPTLDYLMGMFHLESPIGSKSYAFVCLHSAATQENNKNVQAAACIPVGEYYCRRLGGQVDKDEEARRFWIIALNGSNEEAKADAEVCFEQMKQTEETLLPPIVPTRQPNSRPTSAALRWSMRKIPAIEKFTISKLEKQSSNPTIQSQDAPPNASIDDIVLKIISQSYSLEEPSELDPKKLIEFIDQSTDPLIKNRLQLYAGEMYLRGQRGFSVDLGNALSLLKQVENQSQDRWAKAKASLLLAELHNDISQHDNQDERVNSHVLRYLDFAERHCSVLSPEEQADMYFKLAIFHYRKKPKTEENLKKAFDYFQKILNQSFNRKVIADARLICGAYYYRGFGCVQQDIPKALLMWKQVANMDQSINTRAQAKAKEILKEHEEKLAKNLKPNRR